MNCVELQKSLAAIDDDGTGAEQQAHLSTCRECSNLVAELRQIAHAAGELRAASEPSPRVWNSIEIALRQEGLIRPQRRSSSLLPFFGRQLGLARWLVPLAAVLLVGFGIYFQQHPHTVSVASNDAQPTVTQWRASGSDFELAGLNDDDLLQESSQQSPVIQAQYADNLRSVNEYIADAKTIVAADPNDEDARRSLMEAYQQKAMLFELALDRSLQ